MSNEVAVTGQATPELKIAQSVPGRAAYIEKDGTVYIGRNYRVFRSRDDGASWTQITRMPCPTKRRVVQFSRMACRLLRHELRAFTVLSDGTHIAANRESVFHARPGEDVMTPSEIEREPIRAVPPMCLTVGPEDRILWGEYTGSDRARREVRMYVSDDRGRSYQVFHRFEPGSIRHVHNLVFDPSLEKYWVLVGDHNEEPGIGLLSADLKDFDWVVKGKQIYRAVCLFDFGDRIVYGTDTEMEPNAVMSLDKRTGRVERLCETTGSCIYSCRFGDWYVLSTTVEPSQVNQVRNASLWVSRDGEQWSRVFDAAKDRWSEKYFQFGSLVLPRGESDRETVYFSGQALRKVDGKTVVAGLRRPER